MNAANRRPRGSDTEKAARSAAMQVALKGAMEVPPQVTTDCVWLLDMAEFIAESETPDASREGEAALLLAPAGALGASRSVEINLPGMQDSGFTAQVQAQFEGVLTALDAEVQDD